MCFAGRACAGEAGPFCAGRSRPAEAHSFLPGTADTAGSCTAAELGAFQDVIGDGDQGEMLSRLVSRVAALELAVTEAEARRRDAHNQLIRLRGNVRGDAISRPVAETPSLLLWDTSLMTTDVAVPPCTWLCAGISFWMAGHTVKHGYHLTTFAADPGVLPAAPGSQQQRRLQRGRRQPGAHSRRRQAPQFRLR